jgi:hypothetical protein
VNHDARHNSERAALFSLAYLNREIAPRPHCCVRRSAAQCRARWLLLSELATRERLPPQRERGPGLRSTLAALLRLYRAWRESGPAETR